jgi:Phage tail tube protein
MPLREQIDSSEIEFRVATEPLAGDATDIWYPLDPNSIKDFGPDVSVTRRETLSVGRREQKGVVTGLDASGGYATDATISDRFADQLRAYFFAAFRDKDDTLTAAVDGTGNAYTPAAGGDAFVAGDLIAAKDFIDTPNNGFKIVTGTPGATNVDVTDTGLVTATAQTGTISRVGYQFGTGEVAISLAGTLPVLNRVGGAKDLTDFGLSPGEWIHIGGDAAITQFDTPEANGWVRIKSITATDLEIDKADIAMIADAGTGKTIQIFFGRVVRDETGTDIVRTLFQFEESLGVPDTDNPTEIQAIYGVSALASEFSMEIPTEDIVRCDLGFIMTDYDTRLAAQNRKAGTRPNSTGTDALNSTNDVTRFSLSRVDPTNEFTVPLFAHIQQMTVTINNNLTANKAVKVLGNIGVSAGRFSVGIKFTAYFRDVDSIQSVRDNADLSADLIFVKSNRAMTFDFPICTPSGGRPEPEVDKPITVPIELICSTGARYDSTIDHTLMVSFFDYVPDFADKNQQS